MKAYILVIDDNEVIRRTLTQILKNAGYEVHCEPDGRQGLQAFHKRQPDLVITDIIMPDMDGIETIMKLRALPCACPIIAISGGRGIGSVDYLTSAKLLGAAGTLRKPFEAKDLLQMVSGCLAKKFAGPALSPRHPIVAAPFKTPAESPMKAVRSP
jgi:CheY-like chemotaxis protein